MTIGKALESNNIDIGTDIKPIKIDGIDTKYHITSDGDVISYQQSISNSKMISSVII